jgi:hypothetical protein
LKAEQFWTTNGFLARGPWAWMARATSSLPVPLSPWISTVDSLFTIFSSRRSISRTVGLEPTISLNGWPAVAGLVPTKRGAARTHSAATVAIRSRRCSSSASGRRGSSATARAPSPSTSANSRTLRKSSAVATGANASRTLPPVNTNPASSSPNHSGAATTSKPR